MKMSQKTAAISPQKTKFKSQNATIPPLALDTDQSSSSAPIRDNSAELNSYYATSAVAFEAAKFLEPSDLVTFISAIENHPESSTSALGGTLQSEGIQPKELSVSLLVNETDTEDTKDPGMVTTKTHSQDSHSQQLPGIMDAVDQTGIGDNILGEDSPHSSPQLTRTIFENDSTLIDEAPEERAADDSASNASDTIIVVAISGQGFGKKNLKRSPDESDDHEAKRLKASTESPKPRSSKKLPRSKSKVFFHNKVKLDAPGTLQKLRELGISRVHDIQSCDYYCIPRNAVLKRSPNILEAVLRGKQPITDEWIDVSFKLGDRVELSSYSAQNSKLEEQEWKTTLSKAVQRGKAGVKPLKGHKVAITSALKTNLGINKFEDLKRITLLAGAQTVKVVARVSGKAMESSLICGLKDEPLLKDMVSVGQRCFSMQAITVSILRGSVDSAEEFLITGSTPHLSRTRYG